ncbi:MAG: FAD-binding oxidoreductase [Bacteroidetes bacterium]|nr:FAD-binding oxidoreductase [Bacteroidota bacterium]
MVSFWEHKTYFSNLDAIVVGSGIVGLTAAIHIKLSNPKLSVLVVERGFLPSGASTKNAGFACFGSPSELLDDIDNFGEDKVFQLVEKRYAGLQYLINLLGKEYIGYTANGGHEVFDSKHAYERCADRLTYLNGRLDSIIGKDVFSERNNLLNEYGFANFSHLIANKFEAQIDTGLMMESLIEKAVGLGVKILNGISINCIQSNDKEVVLDTANSSFQLKAKGVIVATNGFAKQLIPSLAVNPARAQVLITKPIEKLKLSGSFHFDEGYYYFRNVGNRVLLGGGRNLDKKGETTYEMGLTDAIQNKLEQLLRDCILPKAKYEIDMRWSGIMGMESDKSYIIKAVYPNVFCAVRMGGMGVALGSLVGNEVADQFIRMFKN